MSHHAASQTPGVTVASVIDPTQQRRQHRFLRPFTRHPFSHQFFEFGPISYGLTPLQTTVGRIDHKTQKGESLARRTGLSAGVDGQPLRRQPLNDRLAPGPERLFIVGEQERVIHIARVPPAAQPAFDKMVKWIQKTIRLDLQF